MTDRTSEAWDSGLALESQSGQQFVVDAAEPAVAHDEHMVAGLRRTCDRFGQRRKIVVYLHLSIERRERGGDIPTEIRRIAVNVIRINQAVRQRRFHHAKLHRVRTRFEDSQNARAAHGTAQTIDRGRDRRGVMSEVIVDSDAADNAASFEPTFQKHAGLLCHGAQLHVTDRDTFLPFHTGVQIIRNVRERYGRHFQWKQPPYEYDWSKAKAIQPVLMDMMSAALDACKALYGK